MNPYRAQTMALDLMRHHGLQGWTMAFNRRKRAHGLCDYTRKTIMLSEPLTALNDEETVLDTILHEIAHAIAGKAAHHGWIWRQTVVDIGGRPERLAPRDASRVPAPYVLVCSTCGRSSPRHRRPRRVLACSACCREHNYGRFDSRFVLSLRRAS